MKFYFFGDSICVGQYVNMSDTWVSIISTWIKENYKDIDVSNRSINGNTTHDALARMHFEVLSHQPEIVYIQFGLNDCNIWDNANGLARVLPNTFRANILEMVARLKAFGAKKIFIGNNHPTLKNKDFLIKDGASLSYEENSIKYNNILKDICMADEEIILVDHYSNMERTFPGEFGIQESLLQDGIHLSVAGHYAYSEHMKTVLKNYL